MEISDFPVRELTLKAFVTSSNFYENPKKRISPWKKVHLLRIRYRTNTLNLLMARE